MSTRFHGIFSLGLALAAVSIAGIVIARSGMTALAAYAAACLVGAFLVLAAFCAKCPCRVRCGHLLPGLAVRFLPSRREGPCGFSDYLLTTVGITLVMLPPQFFLPEEPWLLAVFWVLLAIATLEIRSRVCPACDNRNCPLNATATRTSSGSN